MLYTNRGLYVKTSDRPRLQNAGSVGISDSTLADWMA